MTAYLITGENADDIDLRYGFETLLKEHPDFKPEWLHRTYEEYDDVFIEQKWEEYFMSDFDENESNYTLH